MGEPPPRGPARAPWWVGAWPASTSPSAHIPQAGGAGQPLRRAHSQGTFSLSTGGAFNILSPCGGRQRLGEGAVAGQRGTLCSGGQRSSARPPTLRCWQCGQRADCRCLCFVVCKMGMTLAPVGWGGAADRSWNSLLPAVLTSSLSRFSQWAGRRPRVRTRFQDLSPGPFRPGFPGA